MTTTSFGLPFVSVGPNGPLPVVIRTRAIRSPALATPPTNDRPPSVTLSLGANSVRIKLLLASKNSNFVVFGKSTSLKTAPKPATVAGVAPLLPGIEKVASVMLLPSGVKIRWALKVPNVVAYAALILVRSATPSGVCKKPVPGVVKVPPRLF